MSKWLSALLHAAIALVMLLPGTLASGLPPRPPIHPPTLSCLELAFRPFRCAIRLHTLRNLWRANPERAWGEPLPFPHLPVPQVHLPRLRVPAVPRQIVWQLALPLPALQVPRRVPQFRLRTLPHRLCSHRQREARRKRLGWASTRCCGPTPLLKLIHSRYNFALIDVVSMKSNSRLRLRSTTTSASPGAA